MAVAVMSRRRALIGLGVAAAALRVGAAVVVGGDRFRFVDESLYTTAATRLLEGQGVSGVVLDLPGYPAFLALLQLLLPSGLLAIRLGQAAIGALGVPLAYGLGRRLGGETAGLTAATVYALDPLLVASAGLLYPETAAALLVTAAVLTVWSAVRHDRLPLTALAGALLGLVTLFRPVSIAFAPAMLGWVSLGPDGGWRRRAAHAGLLLGAWGLVMSPWMASNLRATGHLLPAGPAVRASVGQDAEQEGVVQAIVSTATRDPVGVAGRTLREFLGFWELAPTRVMTDDPDQRARLARRFPAVSAQPVVDPGLRDVVSAVSFGLELALALVGLAVAWRHRRLETLWLVALVLGFALGYALFFGKVRYRIPILPIVFGYAGVGAAFVWGRLRQRGREGVVGVRNRQ